MKMTSSDNSFSAKDTLAAGGQSYSYYRLDRLSQQGLTDLDRLPFSIRILLENLLRKEDGLLVTATDIENMARWSPENASVHEVPFMPARILLQDFTGVPAVVDLAAMRDAAQTLFGDPDRINPQIPAELVIDHSVQVDRYGSPEAFEANDARDYERNAERYAFLRWGQNSFQNFSVVPPATGICHQVNLEHLARVVFVDRNGGQPTAYPDTLVGLDSHTTMINGIGVMGWGVGGIEAEAVMLGRPYYLLTPQVVGFRLVGRLREGVTATDLVLTVTEILRQKGVVGKFVEFFGPGLSGLSLEDRATIANMSPEYGATMGFFPVDDATLRYLALTGRSEGAIALIETYCKEQGLFRTDASPDPEFSAVVELDLETVVPSLAGPKRPQDRIPLSEMQTAFHTGMIAHCDALEAEGRKPGNGKSRWEVAGGQPTGATAGDNTSVPGVPVSMDGDTFTLDHGAVVIAAITSCTNTSNPTVLVGAGLMARKAVERGLSVKPWVKTSLAPGSKVVMDYLAASGLQKDLDALKFHHVAYGCTTCIGNSGPLAKPIADAVAEHDLVVASVLSGNRNFEGRINPLTRINYLASPLLVVAYALAGTVNVNLDRDPLGTDRDGKPVYLKEIWPTPGEIGEVVSAFVTADRFRAQYETVFEGSQRWQSLPVPEGGLYQWSRDSTYIKKPPFFDGLTMTVPELTDIRSARVLALLGDSVTTDHISPAGAIPEDGPAGQYLQQLGVSPTDFNSFGSRRGNHEVMMRGTFGNIRLQNLLVPGSSGGVTLQLPGGGVTSIYDAAMAYARQNTPLIVLAGKEYGTGSSRDWAAVLVGDDVVVGVFGDRSPDTHLGLELLEGFVDLAGHGVLVGLLLQGLLGQFAQAVQQTRFRETALFRLTLCLVISS
jgi:aconitate hydratase